mgnify:CR=1 FL=1
MKRFSVLLLSLALLFTLAACGGSDDTATTPSKKRPNKTAPGLIRPGARYRASVWVRIRGLTDAWEWFRLGIYWLDSQGQFVSETREPETDRPNFGSHGWKQVFAEGDAPPEAAFAKVYLHHHFVHGTVWFDDASLAEIPAVQEKRAPE